MDIISASLEDYLEAIYFLLEKTDTVRVSDIADLLDVKRPSVVKSLIKLKEKGYITQEHYGRIDLTSEGLAIARNVAGRHHVIKSFLQEILNVDGCVAEEDACRIEHVINPQTYNNFSKFIEFMNSDRDGPASDWLNRFKSSLKVSFKETK